jgi:hypothetical protein
MTPSGHSTSGGHGGAGGSSSGGNGGNGNSSTGGNNGRGNGSFGGENGRGTSSDGNGGVSGDSAYGGHSSSGNASRSIGDLIKEGLHYVFDTNKGTSKQGLIRFSAEDLHGNIAGSSIPFVIIVLIIATIGYVLRRKKWERREEM